MKLKHKVPLYFIFIALLSIILTTSFAIHYFINNMEHNTYNILVEKAKIAKLIYQKKLEQVGIEAQNIAYNTILQKSILQKKPSGLEQLLEQLVKNKKFYHATLLKIDNQNKNFNLADNVLAYVGLENYPLLSYRLKQVDLNSTLIQKAITEKKLQLTPERLVNSKVLILSAAIPILYREDVNIFNPSTKVIGLLLLRKIVQNNDVLTTEISQLLNVSSALYSETQQISSSHELPPLPAETYQRIVTGQLTQAGLFAHGHLLNYYQPLYDLDKNAVAVLNINLKVDEYVQAAHNTVYDLLWIALFCLLITVFFSYFLLRNILTKIVQLLQGVQHIQANTLTHRIPVVGDDELSTLGQSFNVMAEWLQQTFALLENNNKDLIKLNQDKNEFLGIVVHDLKNPLSAICGLAEHLHEESENITSKELVEYAALIETASTQMLELVKNLLDVNAIEQGKININLVEADLLPVVEKLINNYRNVASNKKIEIHFQTAVEQLVAFADPRIVHQIFDNLISNAIKYSPPLSNIYVRCTLLDHFARFEVQDTGPGLSPEDLSQLFGKFSQLTPRPTADEHSTGLGLFIVKKLVSLMQGEVGCESQLGQGCTFFVMLQTK